MTETYTFVEGKLVNQLGQSIMMDWEHPIMKKVAEILYKEKQAQGGDAAAGATQEAPSEDKKDGETIDADIDQD